MPEQDRGRKWKREPAEAPMLTRRQLLQAAALATIVPTCRSTPGLAQTGRYGFLSTRSIAEAGFIYGLPIVISYATMYEHAVDRKSAKFKAPFNQIKSEGDFFTYKDAAVSLPNNDTLYSVAWLDLRVEPIVLSVPVVDPNRYYSITLRDGKFYTYGYIGSRATQNQGGDYMVVGPKWSGEVPRDIKEVFRSSTQFSIAMYRTQLFNPDDIDNVRKAQADYGLKPLSKKMQQSPPLPARTINFQEIRKQLLRKNFFQHLAFASQFAPAQFIESDAHENLAKLGVGPGKTFDFSDLSFKEKLAIISGISAGDHKIDRTVADAQVVLNGWRIAPYFGGSTFYSGNWLLRAAAAKSDFYGSNSAEAAFLFASVDKDGDVLDGSKRRYTLTFAPNQLPPVDGFWSLTMYDSRSGLLIRNPMNRYLVNLSMLPMMKRTANGALTIYIQHQSPGPDRKANWLPAPNGPMVLGMRLYWPKTEPPSILPIGKGTWKPPSVKPAL
jgi:hypothetical protein